MTWLAEIRNLAGAGLTELARKARAGELGVHTLWLAITGTKACRAAMVRGDIADPDEAQRRAAQCMLCPCRTDRPLRGHEGTAHWCGQPLEDRLDAALPTCGCLVALTVGGVTRPACATMVRSKPCPQSKF
jgi:hypothetical protein